MRDIQENDDRLIWQDKLRNVVSHSFPATIALFLSFVPEIINLSIVGQNYDKFHVNALGLASILNTLILFTIMYGISGALFTILAQAYGAKAYSEAGHALNTV